MPTRVESSWLGRPSAQRTSSGGGWPVTRHDGQHVSLDENPGKEGLRNHNGTRWRIVRTEVLFVCLSQLVEVFPVGQVNPDHDDIVCATNC